MASPADIARLDALARKHFTYAQEASDRWRSHADDVLAGRAWAGDCDDLASTVLDLLARSGVAPDHLIRCKVSTTGSNVVDHMVGVAVDDHAKQWVVGDTFRPAYAQFDCRHRFLKVAYVVEGALWREPG